MCVEFPVGGRGGAAFAVVPIVFVVMNEFFYVALVFSIKIGNCSMRKRVSCNIGYETIMRF